MTNIEKKHPSPDIRNIARDQHRLQIEKQVRLDHNMLELNESNRLKFVLLVEARLHPQTELARWVREMMFIDKDCFERMALTSVATIDRDNRALEAEGFFRKQEQLA